MHPDTFRHFVPAYQRMVIKEFLKGEEKAFFAERISTLDSCINAMPSVYDTNGIPAEDKVFHLKYFGGAFTWYIVEKDSTDEQVQAYGLTLNASTGEREWGYIAIQTLLDLPLVEIDLHFDPTRAGDIIPDL